MVYNDWHHLECCPVKSGKIQQWVLLVCLRKFGEAWQYDELKGMGLGKRQTHRGTACQESTGPNPTDRGKKGSKRHLLVDENGVPICYSSAQPRHDSVVLESLLQAEVVSPTPLQRNLCLDAGYVGKEEVVQCHGFIPHIRPRGEEKQERAPDFKARRWVV